GTGRGALRRDLEQSAHPGREGAVARDPAAVAAPAGPARYGLARRRAAPRRRLAAGLADRAGGPDSETRLPEGVPRIAGDGRRLTGQNLEPVGYVDVAGVGYTLPDGRVLFADVSFRVGEGTKVALVGPNGAGKTTLLRMVAGDIPVRTGTVARSGGLGVMRQFIGMIGDETTLETLALGLAAPALRVAGERLTRAETAMHAAERRGKLSSAAAETQTKTQMAYADALTTWGEAGGYDAEVLFDTVSVAVLDLPWEQT